MVLPQDNYNQTRTAPETAERFSRRSRSSRRLSLAVGCRAAPRSAPGPRSTSLGRAVTILLRHAAALPPIDRASAVETIDALLRSGAGGQTAAELEVPALVVLYQDLVVDRSRHGSAPTSSA